MRNDDAFESKHMLFFFSVKSASVSANENLLFFFPCFFAIFSINRSLLFEENLSSFCVESSVEPAFFWSFHESFINTHVQETI